MYRLYTDTLGNILLEFGQHVSVAYRMMLPLYYYADNFIGNARKYIIFITSSNNK